LSTSADSERVPMGKKGRSTDDESRGEGRRPNWLLLMAVAVRKDVRTGNAVCIAECVWKVASGFLHTPMDSHSDMDSANADIDFAS